MTKVTGPLRIVTGEVTRAPQVRVFREGLTPGGGGLVTSEVAFVMVDGEGMVAFDCLPGPAILRVVGAGLDDTTRLLVPDKPEASLEECMQAAGLADNATQSVLEDLARRIVEGVAAAEVAASKATEQAETATEQAEIASDAAVTATEQAGVASGHADAAGTSAAAAAESEKSAKASEQAAAESETSVKASEERVATIAGSTRWVGTKLEVNGVLSPDLKGDLPVVYSTTPPEDKNVIWVNPDEELPTQPGTSDLESLEARLRAVEAQLNESPENTPTNKWQPGEVYHGRWRVVYNGYGTVNGSLSRVYMNPAAPEALSQTHAALVTNEQVNEGDLDFVVTVKTLSQTRKNDPPNPWECAWVMWDWTAEDSFYAVALKPNGWEISKQDSTYDGNQRYIGSNTTPTFDVGVPYRIWVKRTAGETYVRWAVEDASQPDGIPATGWNYLWHFTDTERPLNKGKIAFYVEDAEVEFTGLVVR